MSSAGSDIGPGAAPPRLPSRRNDQGHLAVRHAEANWHRLGGFAVIGGAAVLAGSMQGPIAAVVLLLELTHGADGLMVPILRAVAEATIVARLLGAQSIYSARLNVGDDESEVAGALGPLQPAALDEPEPVARR